MTDRSVIHFDPADLPAGVTLHHASGLYKQGGRVFGFGALNVTAAVLDAPEARLFTIPDGFQPSALDLPESAENIFVAPVWHPATSKVFMLSLYAFTGEVQVYSWCEGSTDHAELADGGRVYLSTMVSWAAVEPD